MTAVTSTAARLPHRNIDAKRKDPKHKIGATGQRSGRLCPHKLGPPQGIVQLLQRNHGVTAAALAQIGEAFAFFAGKDCFRRRATVQAGDLGWYSLGDPNWANSCHGHMSSPWCCSAGVTAIANDYSDKRLGRCRTLRSSTRCISSSARFVTWSPARSSACVMKSMSMLSRLSCVLLSR
jgi:hypothetical protein